MAEDANLELNEPEEEMTVTLTLDDGTELECIVLSIFEAGKKDYIALLPVENIESEDGEVYLYRYSEDENGEPILDNIESDEEYEIDPYVSLLCQYLHIRVGLLFTLTPKRRTRIQSTI